MVFRYKKGYQKEICDFKMFGHALTHTGAITKRGLHYNANQYMVYYYFDGDGDIRGWYAESSIQLLGQYEWDVGGRKDPSVIEEVPW